MGWHRLGDNIFYGYGFVDLLNSVVKTVSDEKTATAFGYWMNNPERYGVCTFDGDGNVTSIEEKPEEPKSNHAVVGLYFYSNSVIMTIKEVKSNSIGELEITSLNQAYFDQG